jgi:hypothetical protein
VQGEQREVDVEDADRDERAAERHAVVQHEGVDPAAGHVAQLRLGHAEIAEVVREELAAQAEEHREPACEEETYRGEHQQRRAVPDHGAEQPA